MDKLYVKEGMTLLELLLVVVIVVMLATLGMPFFTTAKHNLSLKGTARSLASFILMAKNRSIRGGKISLDFSNEHEIRMCNGNSCYCDLPQQSLHVSADISLESPLSCFFFDRGFPKRPGGPFAALVITLTHNKTNRCFVVVISKTGRVRVDDC